MFFDKKNKKQKKCENCGGKAENQYSFCPHCGNSFLDFKKEREDFGLLGRDDFSDERNFVSPQGFGITDKLIGSLFNSVMKNLDKQFKNQLEDMGNDLENAEIRSFPNGVRIKISGLFAGRPAKAAKQNSNPVKRSVNEKQIKRMSSLPRAKARTNVKRIGNRVVYELSMPGVSTSEDVFVSKLESGYEIKAIGSKKVYVNSVPINLPLKGYSILNNKLLIEFVAEGR